MKCETITLYNLNVYIRMYSCIMCLKFLAKIFNQLNSPKTKKRNLSAQPVYFSANVCQQYHFLEGIFLKYFDYVYSPFFFFQRIF